jgi:hypothetical protein
MCALQNETKIVAIEVNFLQFSRISFFSKRKLQKLEADQQK